jgi:serine/threonine protein kinase
MVPSPIYCTNCGVLNQAQAKFCFGCGQSLQSIMPSSTNSSTGLLVANHLLKQRYRIQSRAGKGGFAAVYKAEDTLFGNRLVAVKEMSQGGLSQQEIIQASRDFKREALLLVSLSHQNLPRIHDYFHDSGRWYLVMDFIDGVTIDEYLNNSQGQSLPVGQVLDIGIQLCNVLDYLHTRQPPIIFRDLKPANVMLTPDGFLYLIDFGIARHFKPGQARDTIAFGSPGYAAPEQYGKAQTTPQADIYSLGSTRHQLLSGCDPSQTPFQFAPLQLLGLPVSAELEHLIRQMVELETDKRPASMEIVKNKLLRLVAGEKARNIITLQSGLSSSSSSLSDVSQVSQQPNKRLQTTHVLPLATPLYTYKGHSASVVTVAWSPDGQHIASASHDHTVHVWDALTGIRMHTLNHRSLVNAVAWSAHGKYLASASNDKTVQVWEDQTGSSNERSRSNDKTVQIWEATTGHCVFTYNKHYDWVTSLAWSLDGHFITSGSADKTVQVWNAVTGDHIFTYKDHADKVNTVAWSPGGKYIASGSADGVVQICQAPLKP